MAGLDSDEATSDGLALMKMIAAGVGLPPHLRAGGWQARALLRKFKIAF